MVSCTIRVSDVHVHSDFVSIQQEHIELHLKGQLYSILVCTKSNELLKEYKGDELAELLGSAVARGRRQATNKFTGANEFYYLGSR
jgi:hypothetical protein